MVRQAVTGRQAGHGKGVWWTYPMHLDPWQQRLVLLDAVAHHVRAGWQAVDEAERADHQQAARACLVRSETWRWWAVERARRQAAKRR